MQNALRGKIGAALEAGRAPDVWPLRWVEGAWGHLAERRLRRAPPVPAGCRVVSVGSAVLGGAGKTPLCIAVAGALAARLGPGRVAVVGHAYRGRPGRARVVGSADDVRDVGDDALFAARALAPAGVSVVVAPRRGAALHYAAARGADTIVVDGLLRGRAGPAHRSVLVLDGEQPWGSGSCPPLGDLRAPRAALLAASDIVAWMDDVTRSGPPPLPPVPGQTLVRVPTSTERAVAADGTCRELAEWPGPIGLVTTVAHPERIVRALERRGIEIATWVRLADHAGPTEALRELRARAAVGVWLAPERSAVVLPEHVHGAPIAALEHRLDVRELVDALDPPHSQWADSSTIDPRS